MNILGILNSLNSLKTSPLGIFDFIPRLETLLKEILMNQEQLLKDLETLQATQDQVKATLDKVMTEVSTLITALANTSNELSPEVTAAVDKLIATSGTVLSTAQTLDSMNADKVEEVVTTEEPAPVAIDNLSGASPS